VLPAILLVLGFLLTAAVVRERAREEGLAGDAASVLELVRRRQATIRDLTSEAEALTAELTAAQRAGARESDRVRTLLARVDRLRPSTGLAAVDGPGVVVVLADSEEAPATVGEASDLRIQDVDVQLVVNSLWAAGAEAVAVNGRRVASTTAIRQAGGAVLVNFHDVASPYRVAAIGDPDALRRGVLRSEIARRFEVWRQVYGLGFEVRTAERVEAPAVAAAPGLGWARPSGATA
jgi:uncharacterized protein YlxW (UPF0749 family)